jgi:hypothetical protein
VVQATTAGQLAARSIDSGVRNSLQFQLSTPTGADQLIRARVQGTGATGGTYCAAWYYSATERTIRYKRFTPATPTATAIVPATFTAAERSSWLLLLEGVRPAEGRPATDPVFSQSGATLKLDITVAAGRDQPTPITSSSTRRLTLENTQCY